MNHKKLREEKNCLNCGHVVEERFCPQCGQENLQIQDTVFHLMLHYFQDLVHYDGRLWHTLKNLVIRPGLVAMEYMEGKRKKNLAPIQFYVFASSVFFIVLFFMVGSIETNTTHDPKQNYSKRLYQLKLEREFVKGTPDTAIVDRLISSIQIQKDSLHRTAGDSTVHDFTIGLSPGEADTDTAESDGWLGTLLLKKFEEKRLEMERENEGDEVKATTTFLEALFHKMPQLLFLSMPFIAFFLKMLYWRSTGKTYVSHFIFSMYLYAYFFSIMTIYLLFDYGLDKMGGNMVASVQSYGTTAIVLYPFIYLYLSMKRFYNDRWGRLTFRYFILLFFFVILILILFLGIALGTLLW